MFQIDIDLNNALIQERLQEAEKARKQRDLIRLSRAEQNKRTEIENDPRE
jgi:hypothetical protein